jgi:DNA invertase Pin-like site-specific DNA recombinase
MTASNENPPNDRFDPRRLVRRAIVYVRQAATLRDTTGELKLQRALVARALLWGWPPRQIEVINADRAQLGSTSPQRSGFERLLRLMETNQVGLVLTHDITRLGRNVHAINQFVIRAIVFDVLVVFGDKVLSTGDLRRLFCARDVCTSNRGWGLAMAVERIVHRLRCRFWSDR